MLFKRHSRKRLQSKDVESLLQSCIQAECLFFKNPTIHLGQLQEYYIDGSELKIAINLIPTPGLEYSIPSMFLSTTFEDLSLQPAHIVSYEQGWHLFFSSELIREIRQIASGNQYQEEKLFSIMDNLLNYLASETG
jgi:hypothetical protein